MAKNSLNPGEGMWLWIINRYMGGNLDAIVEEFKRARFRYVIIKIADWRLRYNTDLAKPLVQKLKANNIEPWGFQYIYGINPELEAEEGAKFANELGLYGYVINAEKEFVNNVQKKNDASAYMTTLKRILDPRMLVGLSSYRYPYRYFINYPWKEFLSGCDFYAPQVYWMGTQGVAAQQLADSISDVGKMYAHFRLPNLPIRPTGACFAEHGWKSSVADIIAFKEQAKRMGFKSIDWWEAANGYASVRDGYDHIYSNPYNPGAVPPPAPEPQPEPGENEVSAEVTAYGLYVRDKPNSITGKIVGGLYKGDRVNVYQWSDNGWARIHPEEQRWIHGGHIKIVEGAPVVNPLYKAKVRAWALYIRSGPSTLYSIAGDLSQNDIVSVYKEQLGWGKISPSEEHWVSLNWLTK